MFKTLALSIVLLLVATSCSDAGISPRGVNRDDGKTFITDRRGQKWDITQAVTLGFKPERFQYGIGKDAFVTLDDSHLSDKTKGVPDRTRVIGINEGDDSKAFSVRKLSRHEVANSTLGKKPVAVGY